MGLNRDYTERPITFVSRTLSLLLSPPHSHLSDYDDDDLPPAPQEGSRSVHNTAAWENGKAMWDDGIPEWGRMDRVHQHTLGGDLEVDKPAYKQ